MWGIVSMCVMMTLWYRRRITLYQNGRIIGIGRVRFISDHWVTLRDVQIAGLGDSERIETLAFSRNRIDLFWRYRPGDEGRLEQLSGKPKGDEE